MSVDQLTDVLNAISHPSRRAMIRQLVSGPARFTDIAKPFKLSLNAITKHLKLLERAGLISREKQGREVFISLQPAPLQLVSNWVIEYEQFWQDRLDRFEAAFKAKRGKMHETKAEND